MQFSNTCAYTPSVFLSIIILSTIQLYIGYHTIINNRYYKDVGKIPSRKDGNIVTNWFSKEKIDKITNNTNNSIVTKPIYTYPQKIFLFSSSPRSGSSYTSNILTAMPTASYYFEPFWINSGSPSIKEVFHIYIFLHKKQLILLSSF